MGVNIEERYRHEAECSIVVMRKDGCRMLVLNCETHKDLIRNLIHRVVEAIQDYPQIDEIMAGNPRTLQILQTCLSGKIRLNLPERRVPGGEHVVACFHRLQQLPDRRVRHNDVCANPDFSETNDL